jgi:hypothetical protein
MFTDPSSRVGVAKVPLSFRLLALSSNQKNDHVNYSSLLLKVLEEAQRTGSFDPIHITRLGQYREVSFLKE